MLIVSSAVTKRLLEDERFCKRLQRPGHQWLDRIDGLIAGGLAIEMIDVPGLLPGYAGRAASAGAVVAYIIREPASGLQATIAPVFLGIDERLLDAVTRSDLALLDGTFYSNDELHAFGSKAKNAGGLGHAPVGGPNGTLQHIAGLENCRVFVHINNTNPMLDRSSHAHDAVVGAGCVIAFDGWEYNNG